MRWETFQFCDLVHLISEVWQHCGQTRSTLYANVLGPCAPSYQQTYSLPVWFPWYKMQIWIHMGQVMRVWLSCYLVLLSNDSKTRKQDSRTFVTWPIYTGYFFITIQHVRVNSSPPGQNGRHFADDIFSCIFTNEKFCILKKNHWSLFLRVQLTITQH